MASRLLRREVCKRLVRHRTLVAAKKVNEQKNFISLLHQQILNNLKDSKIDNLYPIGKGNTIFIKSHKFTRDNMISPDRYGPGIKSIVYEPGKYGRNCPRVESGLKCM